MSTFEVNILNRIKTVEHKISLFENENKKLRVLVEAVSTATTTPTVSTVKAAKEYKSPIATEQPMMRPPSFGGNVGGRRPITFRSTSTRPDAGTFTGLGSGGLSSPASGGSSTTTGGGSSTSGGGGQPTPQLPTGPDYNGDGVVDGADLGFYNANYGNPGFDGAALGALLAGWNPDTSGGGGGQEPPPPPSPPEPFIGRKSGTTTKDIASLSGQRYITYT